MTLRGHALFLPCTAADCLHFANQSVAMVTHPSPSPTKTPISIPTPSICLFPHTAIPPPSLSLAHTDFPLLLNVLFNHLAKFTSQKGEHKSQKTQTPDQGLSPTRRNISIGKQEKAACCLEGKDPFLSHFMKANQVYCHIVNVW